MQDDAKEVSVITTKDQEALFKLVADYLARDITCIAIGGTAMMFQGYKNATKDIDLVFLSDEDRQAFEQALVQLGYKKQGLSGVYDERRRERSDAPHLFSRSDERFDLFVTSVFGLEPTTAMTQRHDFLGKSELIIKVLSIEELILFKAITLREKDQEDIELIIRSEKTIDWDRIIDRAMAQSKNPWFLIDLEETMQHLRTMTFIPEKHFKRIYAAKASPQGKKKKK